MMKAKPINKYILMIHISIQNFLWNSAKLPIVWSCFAVGWQYMSKLQLLIIVKPFFHYKPERVIKQVHKAK